MSASNITDGLPDWIGNRFTDKTRQDILVDFGPYIFLVVLSVIFAFQSDQFLSYRNIVTNILRNSSVILLIALAGTFPILQQSIDLSVAQMAVISAIVIAITWSDFGLLSLPLGILAATIVGTVNGIIFTKLKVPSFLATLGMLSILDGIQRHLTGGSTVPVRDETLGWIANGNIIPAIPNIVLWALLLYVLTIVVAFRTNFGRYTYALGENERVVELSGVKVDRYKILAFTFSGFLCGCAGLLMMARIGSAASTMADGLLLPSIAAIVMGGTALTGGVGGPHRTIIGVIVIAVLNNGMTLMGVDSFTQLIVLGVVVILAVAMSIDRKKIDIIK